MWPFRRVKTLRIIQLLSLLLIVTISSCGEEIGTRTNMNQYTNLGELLQKCKGHAVVKAVGFNDGNLDSRKYLIVIVDDSSNCFEYVGAKYDVEVGDTLK